MRAPGCRNSAVLVGLVLTVACGARTPSLPGGSGTPFPDFPAAYAEATAECRSVHSVAASLGLSGRSGGQPLRGRIDAGLAAPDRARLEGFPPVMYGSRPVFVFVARDGRASLHLPRERRVLRDAPPDAIVEVLAGVALTPAELRAIVAGCGLGDGPVSNPRLFTGGWAAADQAAATLYLRQVDAGWRVAAVTRGRLRLHYDDHVEGRPRAVRLRVEEGNRVTADIRLRLSDVEWNLTLDDRVFEVDVPADAAPLTLEELQASGPLRAGGS